MRGSVHLVGVGAPILVCELGMLLLPAEKVSHLDVGDEEGEGGRLTSLEA